MATHRDNGIAQSPFQAGADLSASANRYRFVALSASQGKVVLGTGASLPAPFGVLQNSPCSGEEAAVATPGMYTKLRVVASTCQIDPGGFIYCGSSGQGERQTSTGSVFAHAIALEQVTSGSAVIEVFLLSPTTQINAAS